MGKVVSARQTISYLLSFQGSVNSESSSSSTTHQEESLGPDAHQVSENRAASSSSSGSVLERRDELATRRLGQESLRDDKKDADDPLSDLPFWLQEFKDNLEATEVHAPAHISQDSDSKHPTTVVTNWKKHGIFTHFPKYRNCDVCLRTKMTRALCRRHIGESLLRAVKFGDLLTADHEVFNEESEPRNNHRYEQKSLVSWYRRITQKVFNEGCESREFNLIHFKTKSSHETEKSLRKFLENQKSFQDWIKGGPTRWNAIAFYDTSKTSWQMGKHHTKDDSKNRLQGQQYLLEQWLNIIRSLQKITRVHQFGKKVLPGISLGHALK